MADALAELLADPARRAVLAQRGRRRVEGFGPAAVAAQYEREYELALAPDAAPRSVAA
jgi:glycosyltransferase involved in cell wall biosynthesis